MNRRGQRFFILSLVTFFTLMLRETTSFQSRIVGGSTINITQVPFILSFRLRGDHICGATVISQDWGLTAAHCVTTLIANVTEYSVRSGSSFQDKGGKIHNITDIIWNDKYNTSNNDYDIAAFKVEPPFNFDETTEAADLPGKDGNIDDSWAIIAGWGYYLARGNVLSEELRYAEIPKIDRNICSNDYAGLYDVTPNQVCYGYEQGGTDSCKGDSGGPLFTEENILIGIISWGEDCAGRKSPGVYTTMFLMTDWIAEKTGVRSRL